MQKILITPRSLTKNDHPALDKLRKAGFELVFSSPGRLPSENELVDLIEGCVGYLAGVEKITKRVLKNADQLKVISRNGTGIDNIDIAEVENRGIKLMRAVGANARGVAELTIALIFSLIRDIPIHDKELKDRQWNRKKGIELEGRILGIVGCGKIGREVTKMALGLGMDVLAYDVYIDKSFTPGSRFKYANFEEVISKSDFITLHVPGSKKGKPIIAKNEISMMKKGVYIVNTARSTVIDIDSLIQALDQRIVAGYAVDVYSTEPPLGKELELIKRNNVIATPHIGGYTGESVNRATNEAVENLLKVLV